MKKLFDLREHRASQTKEARALLDANPGALWSKDHQAKYDGMMDTIGSLDAQIRNYERIAQAEAESSVGMVVAQAIAGVPTTPARALFASWLRGGDSALTAEQWKDIRATMSTGTGSQGGFSVQTDVAKELIDALKYYGGVRGAAEVIRTEKGNPLGYPGSDGTAETGELIGENTTATAADPSFTTVSLNTYKYSSKIIAVPFELLQDSSIDVEAFVRKRMADRLGRITNTHFTTGTGSGQPNGVVTAASSGKVGLAGQTTSIIFDDLIDLIASINYSYRQSTSCKFMTSDANLAKVRKLKDTAGRPIFIPGWDGLGKPMPDTILGYGVVINDDVAAMAANAKSILFGDFSYYKVRDAMDVTMFRFEDSAYAKLGQVGFLAWMRSGGNLVDTTAVKYYANSAT
jgi:HK97 family phage major capsid protein